MDGPRDEQDQTKIHDIKNSLGQFEFQGISKSLHNIVQPDTFIDTDIADRNVLTCS